MRSVADAAACHTLGAVAVAVMQTNPMVSELSLYDVANVPGVAADVSHMNTRAVVKVRWP
jgi:malate dehydrogenase